MSAHFFLQGYINISKTFLYNAICNYFRAKKKIIIYVILSGIAVLLFLDGNISYSRFCILLNFT
jgi:hypothetical protein